MNYITFIGELLQIKYKLDSSVPDFFLKQQISFDKIIEAIKKYIEEIFIKTKNSTEYAVKNLTDQNIILEEKYKNIYDEYNKDKNDFKQTVDKYNDMLIENKLKLKTFEEKIKNFETEKKMIKETKDRNIEEINKKYEDKINNLNMEINKLKTEIKTKDEEILLEKLNKEQLSALDTQKITFLENETKNWKERYNKQSKELSEVKTEKIHLIADNDKLKTEIKKLKNNLSTLNNGSGANDIDKRMNATIDNKKMNSTFANSTSGFYGGANRASNKLLIELLNEQSSIKSFLNEIKNNTNRIIDMNKNIMNNFHIKEEDINENTEKKDNNTNYNYNNNKEGEGEEEFKIINNNDFFKTIDYEKDKELKINKDKTNSNINLNQNNNKEKLTKNLETLKIKK